MKTENKTTNLFHLALAAPVAVCNRLTPDSPVSFFSPNLLHISYTWHLGLRIEPGLDTPLVLINKILAPRIKDPEDYGQNSP